MESGKSSAAQRKNAAEEMSPGTAASMAWSFWPPAMLMAVAACAVEGGTEGAEGVLGVVAGADGLAEAGGAVGLQAGEEDGGLDLRAGDGRVEVDGGERAAVDGDGGVAVDEVDAARPSGRAACGCAPWGGG